MSTINLVIILLLSTALTGGLITVLWAIYCRMLASSGNARYLYMLLRGTIFGYLFPLAVLIGYSAYYVQSGHDIALLQWFSGFEKQMIDLFFLVWLLGVAVFIFQELRLRLYFRRIHKSCFSASLQVKDVLRRVCDEMDIAQPIPIFQGFEIGSPFICGGKNPCIYLSTDSLSEENLKIILYHELTHYKQNDILWKPMFGLIRILYWFSPLAWYQWKMMGRWAEASCDAACCGSKVDAKTYFTLMEEMVEKLQPEHSVGFISMWCEKENELMWRVKCIKNMPGREIKKSMTAMLLVASVTIGLLVTGTTVYGMKSAYDNVVWNVMPAEEYSLDQKNANGEYEGMLESYEEQEGKWFINNATGDERAKNILIDWSIGNHQAYATKEIKLKGNEKIEVIIYTVKGKKLDLGILSPDGAVDYIKSPKPCKHAFHISVPGCYRVFVRNEDDVEAEVFGICMKEWD